MAEGLPTSGRYVKFHWPDRTIPDPLCTHCGTLWPCGTARAAGITGVPANPGGES